MRVENENESSHNKIESWEWDESFPWESQFWDRDESLAASLTEGSARCTRTLCTLHTTGRGGKKSEISHKAASIDSCTQPQFVSNKLLSSKQFENFLCNSVSVYSVWWCYFVICWTMLFVQPSSSSSRFADAAVAAGNDKKCSLWFVMAFHCCPPPWDEMW